MMSNLISRGDRYIGISAPRVHLMTARETLMNTVGRVRMFPIHDGLITLNRGMLVDNLDSVIEDLNDAIEMMREYEGYIEDAGC